MSRKKRKKDDVNPNAWLDTYADTITLLLTFFILLYSISSVDAQKLKELSQALQNSLGGNTKIDEIVDIDDISVSTNESERKNKEQDDLEKKINKILEEKHLTEIIKIRDEERGIVLQLDETILFDSGKADLKKDSEKILNIISTILKETPNDILVEGNTDDVPMYNEEFKSNWELSTSRAVTVIDYFIQTKKLDPMRFSAKGYGEYKPLVKNNSAKNRAINRRVDILILKD